MQGNTAPQSQAVTRDWEHIRIRNIVRLGFAAVLGLTFMLGVLGLYQIHNLKTTMKNIVDVGNEKTALAIQMRDAIRLRALTVQRMLATNDYFLRESELLTYYKYSGMYREAREVLFALPMTNEERHIHEALTTLTKIAQPINRAAAEMLMRDPVPAEFNATLEKAIASQHRLLELLDQFVLLQKRYARSQVVDADQKFQSTLVMMLAVVVMLLLVGAVIARRVTHLVTRKNAELAEKNHELEAAWFEAANATHAKSKFLANMSHEIRTPLTSIIGFAETLDEPNQSRADLAHAAESIKRSGNHLHQIINDVLDISKIEAGQIEMETLTVSPVAVVSEVSAMMEEKVKKKGLQLRTDFQFPLPKKIFSDPTRLRQILLNLLSNAVKFTEQGMVRINTCYLPQERLVKFEVSDTGIGMSPESVARVFEPFSQADKTTTRKFGGSGLGLSISKQLAERMGGDIVCDSQQGVGTSFTAIIPLGDRGEPELSYRTQDIATELKHKPAPVRRQSLHGRVLLAEDTPENQQLIKLQLNKSGIDVVVVGDGRQAVDAALEREFDVILMDMQMPELDGIEAIKCLRRARYTKPILALTANTSQVDKENCLQAGADAFIAKPINFDTFFSLLAMYLSPQAATTCGQQTSPDTGYALPQEFCEDGDMHEIFQTFLANLPPMLDTLRQAQAQQDWQRLGHVAHQLKGLGGTFGYHEVSRVAQQIYACAAEHRFDTLKPYVDAMEQEIHMILESQLTKRKAV